MNTSFLKLPLAATKCSGISIRGELLTHHVRTPCAFSTQLRPVGSQYLKGLLPQYTYKLRVCVIALVSVLVRLLRQGSGFRSRLSRSSLHNLRKVTFTVNKPTHFHHVAYDHIEYRVIPDEYGIIRLLSVLD